MNISRGLRILGPALSLLAVGTVAPAHARPINAAGAAQQVRVIGHVSVYMVAAERNPDRDVLGYRLTLRITGSSFGAGQQVRIAVVSTSPWAVVARGATYARAGGINYRMSLSPTQSAPSTADLLVLYRSPGHVGMQTVTLR